MSSRTASGCHSWSCVLDTAGGRGNKLSTIGARLPASNLLFWQVDLVVLDLKRQWNYAGSAAYIGSSRLALKKSRFVSDGVVNQTFSCHGRKEKCQTKFSMSRFSVDGREVSCVYVCFCVYVCVYVWSRSSNLWRSVDLKTYTNLVWRRGKNLAKTNRYLHLHLRRLLVLSRLEMLVKKKNPNGDHDANV